ncbi:MAG: DUF362 domain-containing protein [Bacillota bacterium]
MKLARREFIAAAGTAAAGVWMAGCSTGGAPTGTPSAGSAGPKPDPAPGAPKSRVVLVRTTDRAKGVREALRLFGDLPVNGKSVLIKPNFNTADAAPASTHPDILTELIAGLKERGASSLTIGERSGGPELPGGTREVMERKGIFQLAKDLGVEVVDFQAADQWVPFKREGLNWKDGFLYARAVAEAGAVVTACCLKTHRYGGVFTLSLKNSVGIVPRQGYGYMSELHSSGQMRKLIAEINLAYSPALAVIDGVEVFTEGGPDRGLLVKAGVVLAGSDRVALDAVGVAILMHLGASTLKGKKIWEQEQIARAAELGLGARGPEEIDLVTGDDESKAYAQEIANLLAKG